MAEYTKIPRLNIASAIGKPVGAVVGVIVTTGNKALDIVETGIANTRERSTILKREIQDIESEAVQRAAELNRQATLETNAILSSAASTAYNEFLNRVTPGRTVAGVSIDVSPGARQLQQEAMAIINRANERMSQLAAEINLINKKMIALTDSTLGVVEASLSAIITAVKTFKAIIQALRAPLAALKVAILVIKALPLPQRYLVVCFTILESDLLEMMEQLISQAEEEIRAIEAILDMIERTLTPLRDRIRRIRALLSAMKADRIFLEASESDIHILDQAGIYDKATGDSIFDKIQEGQGSGNSWGTYGDVGDVNINSPRIGDQIRTRNPGDSVQWLGNSSGSYIEDYYKWQENPPSRFKLNPELEGWSRYPDPPSNNLQEGKERLWRIRVPETGDGSKFGGLDDPIVEVPAKDWEDLFKTIAQLKSIQAGVGNKSTKEGEVINYDPLLGYRFSGSNGVGGTNNLSQYGSGSTLDSLGKTGLGEGNIDLTENGIRPGVLPASGSFISYDPLTGFRTGTVLPILGEDNFEQKPGILKPSSWESLEAAALKRLRGLPLSEDLQNYLRDIWQDSAAEEAGTSTLTGDSIAYRAANGEVYYLQVVEDDHSPKVAIRRFVRVKNEAGIVILEGIKTFSLDKDSLIKEMELQLDQLTL